MKTVTGLLAVVPSHSNADLFVRINEQSQVRRHTYQKLSREFQWAELSRASLADVQQIHGHALALAARAKENASRVARLDSTVAQIQKFRTTVEPDPKDGQSKEPVSSPAAAAMIPEPSPDGLAKHHGKTLLTLAAHKLVLLQSAALQHHVLAESGIAANFARTSKDVSPLVGDYWARPKAGDLRAWQEYYRKSLGALHRRVYASALNGRRNLNVELLALVDWVTANLENVAKLNAAVALLLEHEGHSDADADKKTRAALSSIAIDGGSFVREMVSSAVAASVCMLSNNGLTLNPRICDVFRRAGKMPLHGKIHLGKPSDLRRLGRLPDGMFVRVQGVLRSVDVTTQDDGPVTRAELFENASGTSVVVIAPFSFTDAGLFPGAQARVSGLFRKAGTDRHAYAHVEAERLALDETYAQDIWKVAFLNLASPYFGNWAGSCNVAFQPTAPTADTNPRSEVETRGRGLCDDEYEKYHDAAVALDDANFTLAQATTAHVIADIGVVVACILAGVTLGSMTPACAAALASATASAVAIEHASTKVDMAEAKLAAAHQAYLDCMHPPIGPTTGLGSATGWAIGAASSFGSGAGDGGSSSDDAVPDWVLNWEEPDPADVSDTPDPPDDDQGDQGDDPPDPPPSDVYI